MISKLCIYSGLESGRVEGRGRSLISYYLLIINLLLLGLSTEKYTEKKSIKTKIFFFS